MTGLSADLHISTLLTRMHSSRMRTGRSLTVCWSLLSGGGGCLLRGVSAPGGSAPRGSAPGGGGLLLGVSAPGGVSAAGGCLLQVGCLLWGCLLLGGLLWGCLLWGGVCSGGVSAPNMH